MILKLTAADAILQQLATENRRVLSDWRAMLLLRRATFSTPPQRRRWSQLPHAPSDVHPLLRQMQRRGELEPIPKLPHIYEVTVPYARSGIVEEYEVLMEVHPYATVSYLSALVFHGLTDQLPTLIYAMVPIVGTADLLPPDTQAIDWEGVDRIPGYMPARVMGRPVQWRRIKPALYFGLREYQPHGYAVRVTSPERTLLDGLQHPERCGGLSNVLQAWALARDHLSLDSLVELVERFDIGVLRQRVGYVLDELGLSHPALARWRADAQRGGSSKLLAAAPYAPRYSERWNLSLNAPVEELHAATA